MSWIICWYCAKQWEAAIWTKAPPCPKCGETKNLKVLKDGTKHNKYYEDDPSSKEERKDEYKDYQD